MKKISAKVKLTLLNGIFISVMAVVVLVIILSLGDNIISTNTENTLKEIVHNNADELDYDYDEFDLDDVNFFQDNVFIVLYTREEEFIAGNAPVDFSLLPEFVDGQIISHSQQDNLYYIYDILSPVEDYDQLIWVRGIIPVDNDSGALATLFRAIIFALPVFVILSIIGSYITATHIFKPLEIISNKAKEISSNEDLSLRINLDKGSSEMLQMANTFDEMFTRLEEAFLAEKRFSSDVSHELRTPTAVILAQCEFATDITATLEDKEEALEVIGRQAGKISGLISNLLELTRLDRGIHKANLQLIDLSKLVEDVVYDHSLDPSHSSKLTSNITPNISIKADKGLLTILISNLITNGITYGDGLVDISLTKEDNIIRLSVADDGIGIPPEHRDKIWQRFYQVDRARTASKSGSMGLGLALVSQIAKLHGGQVELDSTVNKGSIFTVIFK